VDPATGEAVEPVDPLARSRGAEVGFLAMPAAGWHTTLAVWGVELESELLFVGDAGTTEPSDASGRIGLTWANFWRPLPQLRVELDASFARARFHELTAGEDRIPGALERVITAGIAWEPLASGPHAALRIRHFGEYPLTEDGSVRAPATSLLDLNIGWTRGPFRISASVLNRLDARDADIAYFYASRLPGEPLGGVEDMHFPPSSRDRSGSRSPGDTERGRRARTPATAPRPTIPRGYTVCGTVCPLPSRAAPPRAPSRRAPDPRRTDRVRGRVPHRARCADRSGDRRAVRSSRRIRVDPISVRFPTRPNGRQWVAAGGRSLAPVAASARA